jgi:hypothetical protein
VAGHVCVEVFVLGQEGGRSCMCLLGLSILLLILRCFGGNLVCPLYN